jgi:hypothetical protein
MWNKKPFWKQKGFLHLKPMKLWKLLICVFFQKKQLICFYLCDDVQLKFYVRLPTPFFLWNRACFVSYVVMVGLSFSFLYITSANVLSFFNYQNIFWF